MAFYTIFNRIVLSDTRGQEVVFLGPGLVTPGSPEKEWMVDSVLVPAGVITTTPLVHSGPLVTSPQLMTSTTLVTQG